MIDELNSSTNQYSIVVDGVTKTYGNFKALNNIRFEIQPGEIVGFLGPNGAGKTTTMKILTCFMAATEGRAQVAGFDVHAQSQQVRGRVGYLPENVPLYDDMIVYDYLNFIAEVRQIPSGARKQHIDEAVERTGLGAVIHREIRELSKGYRQRVGLAQAIIHRPDVLILDEPTTGLDPNQIIEIRDVIKEIGREKTIIFSTHILQEVTAVCDRIIIINQGEIVADGTLGDLEAAVAETEPGLIVEFEDSETADSENIDAAELRQMLADLPGADAATHTPRRAGQLAFRIETARESEVRASLLKAEVEHGFGLTSLTRAEPTLEDIFRVYTAGATEESRRAS
jgi:ABC-2 type transport system ATP-binding protein